MCWDNASTTYDQQNQCLGAWNTYVGGIDLSDTTLRDLVRQEDTYWGGLSYGEFINLWNDNRRRPPASTTPNYAGDIAGGSLTTAFTASMVWPGLGPEDAGAGIILVGGLCIAALAGIVLSRDIGCRNVPKTSPHLLYTHNSFEIGIIDNNESSDFE